MPTPVIIAGDVIVGDCVDVWRPVVADRLQRLRQPEVEHLHRAVGPHLDVGGLEIAVDDALARARPRGPRRSASRSGSASSSGIAPRAMRSRERRPLDQFHDERAVMPLDSSRP